MALPFGYHFYRGDFHDFFMIGKNTSLRKFSLIFFVFVIVEKLHWLRLVNG